MTLAESAYVPVGFAVAALFMNRRKRYLERRGRPLVVADAPYAVYVAGFLFFGGGGVMTLIAGAEAASGSFGSVARLAIGGFSFGVGCGVLWTWRLAVSVRREESR